MTKFSHFNIAKEFEFDTSSNKYYQNENDHFHRHNVKDVVLTLHYGILVGYGAHKVFWHGIHHSFIENKHLIPQEYIQIPGLADADFLF